MKLDLTDMNILRHLQQDGRISNLKLAEAVFLSPSACLRRVHLLEEAGIIRGYTARLDAELLGLDVDAFVMVTMRRDVDQWHEQFVAALAGWEEVVASFVVTGEANYMLRVRARTLKDYSDFVMNRLYKVPGVLDIRSHMVLRNLGESNVLGAGLMQAGA